VETIQGWKLFKGGNYSRVENYLGKYGVLYFNPKLPIHFRLYFIPNKLEVKAKPVI
jgi:hypothetical protein